jgi:hypothetical protein
LARNKQLPIIAFYVAVEKAWILNSWDRLRIPKPFSRVYLRIGKPLVVPADARSEDMQALHREMQLNLERVRDDAEALLKSRG